MARLCRALGELRGELDATWPQRDTASDGWIGDPAHASRVSDHNPNRAGVVRAIDVDVDGIPAARTVEHLRQLGAAGDRRLRGGYLIFNGRIAGSHTDWQWHEYTGSNPHRQHFHVSAGDTAAEYDRAGGWAIGSLKGHWHATPTVQAGDTGSAVKDLQQHLNAWRRNRRLGLLTADGKYGARTHQAVQTFQRAYGMSPDGDCGPATWAKVHSITKGAKA